MNNEEEIILSQIPKPKSIGLGAKSISSVLNRVIREKGYAAEQSLELLQEQWAIAVGPDLAAQSRVGKIERGVLQIFATSSIAMSELEYTKSKALKHLQSSLAEFKIRSIRIRKG